MVADVEWHEGTYRGNDWMHRSERQNKRENPFVFPAQRVRAKSGEHCSTSTSVSSQAEMSDSGACLLDAAPNTMTFRTISICTRSEQLLAWPQCEYSAWDGTIA